jgi:hypothetical protein
MNYAPVRGYPMNMYEPPVPYPYQQPLYMPPNYGYPMTPGNARYFVDCYVTLFFSCRFISSLYFIRFFFSLLISSV